MSINPFDDLAVEEAVRLKEQNIADEVIALSIGNKKTSEVIRKAMAMGADRGIHIEIPDDTTGLLSPEPLAIAKILQKIVEKENPNLVIMGKQTIDNDSNQTARTFSSPNSFVLEMLAGLLKWPQGTFASKVEIQDTKVNVTREVDSGLETVALKMPAVISCDLRLNEPRYTTLPQIMKARKKPLETIPVADLGVDPSTFKVVPHSSFPPPPREAGQKVETVDQLVSALKEKGVI